MLSETLMHKSLEDEAPKYHLTESEPLWADPPKRTEPIMTPTEYMGAARVSEYGVAGQIDIEVHCSDRVIEVGPFCMTLSEACQLALAIMDGVHWFIRQPERLRIAQELAALQRECEEAPIV